MYHLMNILLLLQEEKSWLLKSDKVYSVLAVLLIIFSALIVYVFLTNKKVKQIEAKIKELEN